MSFCIAINLPQKRTFFSIHAYILSPCISLFTFSLLWFAIIFHKSFGSNAFSLFGFHSLLLMIVVYICLLAGFLTSDGF